MGTAKSSKSVDYAEVVREVSEGGQLEFFVDSLPEAQEVLAHFLSGPCEIDTCLELLLFPGGFQHLLTLALEKLREKKQQQNLELLKKLLVRGRDWWSKALASRSDNTVSLHFDELQVIAEELREGNGPWQEVPWSHPLVDIADADSAWENRVQHYVDKRDYLRAWAELRAAHYGFQCATFDLDADGLLDEMHYFEDSLQPQSLIFYASRKSVAATVRKLYAALHAEGWLPAIAENPVSVMTPYALRDARGKRRSGRIRLRAGFPLATLYFRSTAGFVSSVEEQDVVEQVSQLLQHYTPAVLFRDYPERIAKEHRRGMPDDLLEKHFNGNFDSMAPWIIQVEGAMIMAIATLLGVMKELKRQQ